MKRIVTFGEILLRFSKSGGLRLGQGYEWEGHFGGSEANVAVSLSVLGNKVGYVTRLPDNDIGRACLHELRRNGIDVSDIVWGGERLGSYFFEGSRGIRGSKVVYDRKGSSFYASAPGMFPWKDIFSRADVFHCSGITCAVSQSATDATFEAVKAAKAAGIGITCDINYRKNLWKYEGADASRTLPELMQYSDFIFGDQDEWAVATGVPKIPMDHMQADTVLDMEAYGRYFDMMHRKFPACGEMMLGLRNQMASDHHTLTALLWYHGTVYHTKIWDVDVLDPVGVGDAFVAGYIHAREKWPGDPRLCLDFSLGAATLKNSIEGDFNLSTEEEILDFIAI